jgi:GT2 family glycosyltransferase
MKLSIVVLCYNKWNFTKSCLDDLSKLPKDHEIVVIDNASSDETKSQLEDSKEIVYHRNEQNLGFAAGSNLGYSISSAPNVMFLNNDIRVKFNHSTWTQEIINKCDYGLIGPTMGTLDSNLNFIKEANSYLDTPFSYLSGWCISSSKENWNKLIINDYLGPFSQEFGLAYFEDTDLSFRARKLEIPMVITDIPVVHFGKVSSQQLNTYSLYKSAREIFVNKWGRSIKK